MKTIIIFCWSVVAFIVGLVTWGILQCIISLPYITELETLISVSVLSLIIIIINYLRKNVKSKLHMILQIMLIGIFAVNLLFIIAPIFYYVLPLMIIPIYWLSALYVMITEHRNAKLRTGNIYEKRNK